MKSNRSRNWYALLAVMVVLLGLIAFLAWGGGDNEDGHAPMAGDDRSQPLRSDPPIASDRDSSSFAAPPLGSREHQTQESVEKNEVGTGDEQTEIEDDVSSSPELTGVALRMALVLAVAGIEMTGAAPGTELWGSHTEPDGVIFGDETIDNQFEWSVQLLAPNANSTERYETEGEAEESDRAYGKVLNVGVELHQGALLLHATDQWDLLSTLKSLWPVPFGDNSTLPDLEWWLHGRAFQSLDEFSDTPEISVKLGRPLARIENGSVTAERIVLLDFGRQVVDVSEHFVGVVCAGRLVRPGTGTGVMLPNARYAFAQVEGTPLRVPKRVFSFPDGRFWFAYRQEEPVPPRWIEVYPYSEANLPSGELAVERFLIDLPNPHRQGKKFRDYGDIAYQFGTVDIGVDRSPELWPAGGPAADSAVVAELSGLGEVIIGEERLCLGVGPGVEKLRAALHGGSPASYPLIHDGYTAPRRSWAHHQTVTLRPNWPAMRKVVVRAGGEVVRRGVLYFEDSTGPDMFRELQGMVSIRGRNIGSFSEFQVSETYFPSEIPEVAMGSPPARLMVASAGWQAKILDLLPGEEGDLVIELNEPLVKVRLIAEMEALSNEAATDWNESQRGTPLPLPTYKLTIQEDSSPRIVSQVEIEPGGKATLELEADTGLLTGVSWSLADVATRITKKFASQFPLVKSSSLSAAQIAAVPIGRDGFREVRLPLVPSPKRIMRTGGISTHPSMHIEEVEVDGSVVKLDAFGNMVPSHWDNLFPSYVRDGESRIPIRMTGKRRGTTKIMAADLPARMVARLVSTRPETSVQLFVRLRNIPYDAGVGNIGSTIGVKSEGVHRLWAEPGRARLSVTYQQGFNTITVWEQEVTLTASGTEHVLINLDDIKLPPKPADASGD